MILTVIRWDLWRWSWCTSQCWQTAGAIGIKNWQIRIPAVTVSCPPIGQGDYWSHGSGQVGIRCSSSLQLHKLDVLYDYWLKYWKINNWLLVIILTACFYVHPFHFVCMLLNERRIFLILLVKCYMSFLCRRSVSYWSCIICVCKQPPLQ